jgi:RNA polymerase sigma factor (sigma-70 family)
MQAYADPDPESAIDRAFERLYRRYVKDVYRYTLAVLRNPSDAEDVTQTTFLNAYRAFKSGQVPLKPHHWLIKIAHNACRSRYVRTARRPVEVPLDESLAQVPAAPAEGMDVRELLVALGRLPFNQRAALVMRELDGRSYREIAETLEVTVPAVETLIFRARRRLRSERSALEALGAVQLPPSLASFFQGGGAIAGGGALLGSGVALKAVLLLAAGVVAAGSVSSTGPNATASPSRPGHLSALTESERAAAPARVSSLLARAAQRAGTATPDRRRAAAVARAATRGAFLPAGAGHAGKIAATAQPQEPGAGSPRERAAEDASAVKGEAPQATAPSSPSSSSSPPAPPPVTSVDDAVPIPATPEAPVPVPSVPPVPPVPDVLEPVTSAVPPPPALPPPPPLPKVP